MNNELLVSVQAAGWLNPMLDAGKGEEGFKLMKECGVEALDYNFEAKLPHRLIESGDKGTFFTQSMEEILDYFKPIKTWADKYGIKFAQSHAPFPAYRLGDEEYNKYIIEAIEKCMEVCVFLECPAIVVHPFCHIDRKVAENANLSFYRALIPAAKKYGVKVCLENIFFYNEGRITVIDCSDANRAAALVDRLNEEAGEEVFGFCFDLGHTSLLGTNVREFLRTMGKRITVLHLHDNDGFYDQHLAPMTQRKVDWDGLIDGLRDIGYRGPISFESARSILGGYPEALWGAMIEYTAEVGKYIRKKVLENA